jgi:TonB-dependent receptor
VRADAHYWFETNPERDRLGMAQLAAVWDAGRVQAQGRVFGALGRTDRPDHIEISFWDPQTTRLSGGVQVASVRGFPVLQLNAADAALVANPLAFPVHNQGERESETSQDRRLGGDWRVRLEDAAGWHGEIGGLAVRSWRTRATAHFLYADTLPEGTTLGGSGLVDGQIGPVLRGVYDYAIPTISDAALLAAIGRATVQPRTSDDRNANAYALKEDRLAGYAVVGGPLAEGLDLALGLRGEWSHLGGRYWLSGNDGVPADGVAYGWNQLSARFAALLPSVTLHWRAAPAWTLDAALWTSQTRPSPFQLTGGGSSARDSQGVMEIQLANPDLRAVHGTNLDLGVAWQGPGGLHLALSGFAKRLARYLNDTGNDLNNPDAVMQYRAVRLIRPENGGTATIVGLEASAAVPLGGVARVLRHVALAGDLTMLHSAVRLNNPALDRVERTQYAPASNLLLRLHYDDGRISADAACRLTGAYIQEYGSKCRPLPAPRRFRAARSTPGCGPRAKSTWPWRASGARTHCASRCAMRSTTPPIAPRSAARAMPCRRPSWAGGKCC